MPPQDVSEDASENEGTLSVEWWKFTGNAPAGSWRFEGVEIFRLAGRDALYTFVLKQEGGGTPEDTTILISDVGHGPEPIVLTDMKIRKNRDEYDFLTGTYRFPVAVSSLDGPGPYLIHIELERDGDDILALEFPMKRSADSAP